jgi:hypothetical protein
MRTNKFWKNFANRQQGVMVMSRKSRLPVIAAFVMFATSFVSFTTGCNPEDVPLAGSENTGGAVATGGATSAGGTTVTSTAVTSTGGTVTATGGTVATGGTTATTTTSPVCDENHLGDVQNGKTCIKVVTTATTITYEWALVINAGTGGATGTGGIVGTGGSTYNGNRSIDINASVNCNGHTFVQHWVGRPVNNGASSAKFCMNPAWFMRDAYNVSRSCPSSSFLRVYHEDTLGASVSLALNGSSMPLGPDGFCQSWNGQPGGNYHFSYVDGGDASFWALYAEVAANSLLSWDYKQYIEKNLLRGSYGLACRFDGSYTFSRSTGANY